MHTASLSASVVFLFAFAAIGCSGTATGDGGTSGGLGTSGTSSSSDPRGTGGSSDTSPTSPSTGTDQASSAYAEMFGPPSTRTTTKDSLPGLWADTSTGRYRLRVAADKITAVMQCSTSSYAGLDLAARVDATSMRVLETKSATSYDGRCMVWARPIEFSRCERDYDSGCFILSGTTLEVHGYLFSSTSMSSSDMTFTKLSD